MSTLHRNNVSAKEKHPEKLASVAPSRSNQDPHGTPDADPPGTNIQTRPPETSYRVAIDAIDPRS